MTPEDKAHGLGWASCRKNRIHHHCTRWTYSSSHDERLFWGFTPSSYSQVQDATGFPYLIIVIFHTVLFSQTATIKELKPQSWNRNSSPIIALENVPACFVCSQHPASIAVAMVLVSDTLSPEHYEYVHRFNAIAQTFVWAFTTVSNRVSVGKRQRESWLYLTQT